VTQRDPLLSGRLRKYVALARLAGSLGRKFVDAGLG
jgi:hypothetical protein